MARYFGLLDGKAGAYGIVVPDMPGCYGGGGTIEDTMRDAIGAMAAWADAMEQDGERIPEPRKLEQLRDDPEIAASIAAGAALVAMPLVRDLGRPTKANLSIDAGLLAAIDEAAAELKLTRSAFLAKAAREKIESGR
jgi:predicted RNase H-like HicB family nuclease